ncbi:MAG: response regulator transcription factor [Chloroflexi bacterium]|nr:response regulator transcription factor [Chloroflexota bacterium]
MAKEKILLVDDDLEFYELLKHQLSTRGFEVLHADFWREAIRLAYENHPDLIILDVMMAEMDGFEVCRRLREMSDVPIIMLTARTSKDDLLSGFQAGADDYLSKPFLLDELHARIKALLKRSKTRDNKWTETFDDGNLSIDLKEGVVRKEGEVITLTPTEYQLLSRLVRNRGSVMSHSELVRKVWGTGYLMTESTSGKTSLQLYIGYLRNKLEDDPSEPHYIQTKWGVGYWFAPETYLDTDLNNGSA